MEALGTAITGLAVGTALAYLYAFVRSERRIYSFGAGIAGITLLLLLLEGIFEFIVEGRMPFLDFVSAAMALSFMAMAAALWAHFAWGVPSVGAVLFPIAALVQLVSRIILPDLAISLPQETLGEAGLTAFLVIHVGLVFLGYGLLFVSAAASLMFLLLDHDLRSGSPSPLFGTVPPLSSSAFAARRSLIAGIVLLAIGILLGLTRSLLKPVEGFSFLSDYKVIASSSVLLYFLVLGLSGRILRPKRLAVLIVVGALLILIIHTVLAVAPGLHGFGV